MQFGWMINFYELQCAGVFFFVALSYSYIVCVYTSTDIDFKKEEKHNTNDWFIIACYKLLVDSLMLIDDWTTENRENERKEMETLSFGVEKKITNSD